MSKLSSDNPDLMPITEAVYGKKRPGKPDDHRPERKERNPLFERLSQPVLDELADRFPKARRYAAQRRARAR